jgi:undecaprenyl-diphosphatase
MNALEAFLLGILQGLTEFLPVSSSGHLEIGKAILGIKAEETLMFTVVVHGATVLSTIFVFRKDLWTLFTDSLTLRWNDSVKYNLKLVISMLPVVFLGIFFREEIEQLFDGRVVFVGAMLLVTAALLASTYLQKNNNREINWLDSLIIGIAQAIAVLPGLSRSGATISTGLMLGNKRESVTRFSFLMVLVPIIGANAKDIMDTGFGSMEKIGFMPLAIGFITAFIVGTLACKGMIGIVKKGGLIWFAIYCAVVGVIAIIFG